MKYLALSTLAGLTSISLALAQSSSGFNLGVRRADGSCKSTADYAADFESIASFPGSFRTVKLFSTKDCDALNQAVPAAQDAGISIWAGVWAVDEGNFNAEADALSSAIQKFGTEWLQGVNVGSESLYRNEIEPQVLANRINIVKNTVKNTLGATNVPVGSSDTWTAWVRGDVRPVIDASDVILTNGFPYFQGAPIETALQTFQESVAATRGAIGPDKPLVVGETGWPSEGENFGAAVPSLENEQRYWTETACYLLREGIPFYWFEAFDEPWKGEGVEESFGVADVNRQLKIDLNC